MAEHHLDSAAVAERLSIGLRTLDLWLAGSLARGFGTADGAFTGLLGAGVIELAVMALSFARDV